MTESIQSIPKRLSTNGVALFVLGILLCSAVVNANAQVELKNTIKKIHTTVDADGEIARTLVPADRVVPGDELQYVIQFSNNGADPIDAGSIVITDLVPDHTEYVANSAYGAGTKISYSVDGETFAESQALKVRREGEEVDASAPDYRAIQWAFNPGLAPGDSGYVSFNVRLK
ncbi:MAG: DUF11 domain-containing protein [Pseudomonadales bacterium]|nr:DUF11 domain-containing protein [Pseudomonadales bacterium]